MTEVPPVAICVPLRNEARNLPGLMAALSAQRRDPADRPIVALLLDGCTDASAAIAASMADRFSDLDLHIGTLPRQDTPHAGRARAAALALGLAALGGDGLLLTTDADTRPASDWIAATRRALVHADLVCGRVLRRDLAREPWRLAMETYLQRLHTVRRAIDPIAHDPLPGHPHMGGASLALPAAVYRAVGGLPDLASGEDRALVFAVRRAGYRVRHDPAVRVRTSGRLRGRAEGGLADALRDGRRAAEAGVATLVEHPDDAVARYRAQARVRAAWQVGRDAAPSADAQVMMDVPDRPAESRPVPLAVASVLLAQHETMLASDAA